MIQNVIFYIMQDISEIQMISILIDNKIDDNLINYSIKMGYLKIVKLLNLLKKCKENDLLVAARYGRSEIIKFLYDVNIRNPMTIVVAAREGYGDIVFFLLQYEGYMLTAMNAAIGRHQGHIVKLLYNKIDKFQYLN